MCIPPVRDLPENQKGNDNYQKQYTNPLDLIERQENRIAVQPQEGKKEAPD
jgi:hypothetical protein